MEQTLTFEAAVDGARGVLVFFVISRTTITSCEVRGLPGVTSVRMELSQNGVDVRWDAPLAARSALVLALQVEGEPLAVSKETWLDPAGPVAAHDERLARRLTGVEAVQDSIAAPDQHAHAMFLARGAIIRTHPDRAFGESAGFFYEMDLHTNPGFLHNAPIPPDEMERRAGRIRLMEGRLRDRVLARRDWAAAGNPGPAQDLPVSKDTHIEHVSSILLDFYRQHLSNEQGELDADRAWTTFAAFANGELRVQGAGKDDWNSEPNSAMLFCFAEFALMAIERGIQEKEWRTLLPSHVAIQPIFTRVYRPAPRVPLKFSSYAMGNFSRDRQFNEVEKAALWTEFAGMTLERLQVAAGEHAHLAFPDE